MLSRISDVLQSAADVLAPPATRLEDFEYHWKMVVHFYQNYDETSKVHIEDTRVPHHLHQMLQLIVEEEAEREGCGAVGPCVEAVVARSVALLDALAAAARADRPAGARAAALALAAALLRRTRHPCLHSPHVHRPLLRMLVQCSESPASPTEKEEVELLLTLCGLVRKEPGLANIFTAPFLGDRSGLMSVPEDVQKLIPPSVRTQTPKRNPLFEVEPAPTSVRPVAVVRGAEEAAGADDASAGTQRGAADDCDRFLLIDLLLTYLDSADNQVVLRACEGIMIVASLPEDDIANLVTSSPVCERLVERLARKYRSIPADVDPGDVEHLNITWAYVAHELGERGAGFPGRRQLTGFFSWLDYCDTLAKECHPAIAAHLARAFRDHFLEGAAEALAGPARSPRRALLAAAVLAKSLRAVDSPDLIDEFSNWLVGEGEQEEWPLLAALVDNCLGEDHDLTLETLRFFEAIVEKGTEHSMDRLVLSRLCAREPARAAPPPPPLQDERDRLNDLSFARERERNREAMQQLQHEEHVSGQVGELLAGEGLAAPAPPHLHRTINSLLLLLPRAVLSDPLGAGCDHYVHDAQRHYQLWLDTTASWGWAAAGAPSCAASSTHSCDSRPEADLHLEHFRALHDGPRPRAPDRGPERARQHDRCAFSQTLVLRNGDAGASAEAEAEAEAARADGGPFLRMLLRLLAGMPERPYRVNLHLTAIVSKLALLPHPSLHRFLLEGSGPGSLRGALRAAARRLAAELPRLKNYRALLQSTRLRLMSEEPGCDDAGDHDQLVESLIVLEEFCKELAAIAFVKYQHQAHEHEHR